MAHSAHSVHRRDLSLRCMNIEQHVEWTEPKQRPANQHQRKTSNQHFVRSVAEAVNFNCTTYVAGRRRQSICAQAQ